MPNIVHIKIGDKPHSLSFPLDVLDTFLVHISLETFEEEFKKCDDLVSEEEFKKCDDLVSEEEIIFHTDRSTWTTPVPNTPVLKEPIKYVPTPPRTYKPDCPKNVFNCDNITKPLTEFGKSPITDVLKPKPLSRVTTGKAILGANRSNYAQFTMPTIPSFGPDDRSRQYARSNFRMGKRIASDLFIPSPTSSFKLTVPGELRGPSKWKKLYADVLDELSKIDRDSHKWVEMTEWVADFDTTSKTKED